MVMERFIFCAMIDSRKTAAAPMVQTIGRFQRARFSISLLRRFFYDIGWWTRRRRWRKPHLYSLKFSSQSQCVGNGHQLWSFSSLTKGHGNALLTVAAGPTREVRISRRTRRDLKRHDESKVGHVETTDQLFTHDKDRCRFPVRVRGGWGRRRRRR